MPACERLVTKQAENPHEVTVYVRRTGTIQVISASASQPKGKILWKLRQSDHPFIYDRTTGEDSVSRSPRRTTARQPASDEGVSSWTLRLPERWACDGDFAYCEYRRSGDMASLDVPIGEDGEDTLMDMVPSEAPAIESIIADRDLLDRLFARLRELDPDADTIITMWMDDDNVSDRAIAKALGRPQRTFADQMKKYRTELRRIRGY